jgi:hypothetical protein
MAGVRKQSRGVADIAVDGLRQDQRGVERDADRECLAETGGRMGMGVATMIVIMAVAMIIVMMAVMVVAAHL